MYYDFSMKNGESASDINTTQDVGLHYIYLFQQQILQLIFLIPLGEQGWKILSFNFSSKLLRLCVKDLLLSYKSVK